MIFKKQFNPNALSVSKYWKEAMVSDQSNIVNHLHKIRLNSYRERVEKKRNQEGNYKSAQSILSSGITLLLFEQSIDTIKYFIDSTIFIGEKVYESELVDYEKAKSQPAVLANLAGNRLETYVALACAESMLTPSLPTTEILYDGVVKYNKRLEALNGNLSYSEIKMSALASIMSLLIGEYELSLEILNRCKGFPGMKNHIQILRSVTNEILKDTSKPYIENKEIEKVFFDLFNGYRMPTYITSNEYLNEIPVLHNPLGNYFFSWLYLKLFKGKETTTWEELRIIMMS